MATLVIKPDAHQLEVDTVVEALILAAVDVLVDPALPLGGDAERCTSVF